MSLDIHSVTDFSACATEPLVETIDHPDLLSPPYESRTWVHYQDPSGAFVAGVWEAGSCVEKFVAEHEEFCHILLGTVRLTDEQGNTREFGPGGQFTIAAGFRGLWENLGTVRKTYVTWAPA